ncbi:ATP-binding protein [Sulfurifustis variabilis]|nr:ATP-binding protein [Sulfurifustis variabilis]
MARERPAILRYASAVVGVLAATGLRLLFDPWLGDDRFVFATYFAATLVVAWYGGLGPALLTVVAGTLAAKFFFVPPRGSLALAEDSSILFGLALYVVVAIIGALLSASQRKARREAERVSADALERQRRLEREMLERRAAEAKIARLNHELRHRLEELQTIIELSPVGIAIADDPECRRVRANSALTAVLGARQGADAVCGALSGNAAGYRILRDGQDIPPEEIPMRYAIAHGAAVQGAELDVVRADGDTRTLLTSVAPLFDEEQRVRGAIGYCLDITERKRMERAMRLHEQRLELALAAGRMVAWDWDVNSGEITRSENAAEVLGLPPGPCSRGLAWFLQTVHADDRAAVVDAVEGTTPDRPEYVVQYRYRRTDDGALIWLEDRARAQFDDSGRRVRIDGILLDVTERRAAEQALLDADHRKDEFLAMLAHELRNPLAPMRNAVSVLRLSSGPDQPGLRWVTDLLDRQVDQMTRVVDDLLDISRITRGMISLRRERVAVADVVERAFEISRPLLEARRHHATVSLPPHTVWLEADAVRLAQAISNLLNNAAKFTPDGGHVALVVERDAETVAVRVRDSGQGIPPHILPHVFDLFMQADRSLDRKAGGLGIGLTLVKRLVDLHGGSVAAYSEGAGRGTEFTIRLPAAEAPARAEAPPESRAAPAGEPADRVLIVEDHRETAESLAVLARLWGHRVRTVHDGHAALELARDYAPDLIILDIGLPGMDGYAVAQAMREEKALRDTVIVAATGYGSEDARQRSAAAGFDMHLTKPVDSVTLKRLLADPRAYRSAPLAQGLAAG